MAYLKQKSAVLDRVRWCWKEAQGHFPGFPCPDVYFFDKRRAAGLAHLSANRIGIHETLLVENFDHMIEETVAHEVAHLVVHWNWTQSRDKRRAAGMTDPMRAAPHGCEWKAVMRVVFKVEPERTHSYAMTNVQVRRQRRFAYACPCRTHKVSTVVHNKIVAGSTRICMHCRSRIAFLGEVA